MSGNVTFLEDARAKRGARVEGNEERLHRIELMKLREIESRIRGGGPQPRFRTPQSVYKAARALDDLVVRAKKNGVAIGLIEERIPRLSRYRLNSSYQPESPRTVAKLGTMVMMARKYAEAARLIAEICEAEGVRGFRRDDCVLAVLRGTDIFDAPLHTESSDGEPYEEESRAVALLLEEFAGRFARNFGLSRLFKRMHEVPGQWDILSRSFRQSRSSCLHQTAYHDWFEYWEEAPPLPGFDLFREYLGEFQVPTELVPASPEIGFFDIRRMMLEKGPAPDSVDRCSAKLTVFRKVRLVIGPTVGLDAIGPMFEHLVDVDATLETADQPTRGKLLPPCSIEPCSLNQSIFRAPDDSPIFGVTEDGMNWFRFRRPEVADWSADTVLVDGFYWPKTEHGSPESVLNQGYEHYYIMWTLADAGLCRRTLSLRMDHRRVFGPYAGPTDRTWYRTGTIGQVIENALQDGSLRSGLEAEIEVIRSAFAEHEALWREEMRAQTGALITSFRDDIDSDEGAE